MATSLAETTVLSGANAPFIEDLYDRWSKDPASVDESWRGFFAELNGKLPANGATGGASVTLQEVRAAALDSIRALMLIRAYRVRGHLACKLDPLGIEKMEPHPELDPKSYGFTDADLDRPIFIDNVLGIESAPLRVILQRVRETYCGMIGVEYMHIQDSPQKSWIQERIEGAHNRTEFTPLGKRTILERLTEAEVFERFLQLKFTGTKRFGIEGGEALIPMLEQILKRGSQQGVEEVVIGMPHRGRLNVLANLMQKPFPAIFSEFQGRAGGPENVLGSGDVKYHLGTSADREFDGKVVHLSLSANPSHLEAVDPVVVGKVRAKQRQRKDKERRAVLGLLMHGDAAFNGQGLVAETLALSEIKGYRTGGTVHIVVNNQIGFTTNPAQSRASRYPTEFAKVVQAPIFHVNGDDVEAVVHVARIATEFRQQFRRDVVIDMWCYRRLGHNEADEPAFTQPKMYKAIAQHPTTREVYAKKLVGEGVVGEADAQAMVDATRAKLEQDLEASKAYKPNKSEWLEGRWAHITQAAKDDECRAKTGVARASLVEVGQALTRLPDGFHLHPKLNRFLDARRKMIETGEGIDWATAEALAFGTLVAEGTFVRLSGQDSARGTFSQRHADFIDQVTEQRYTPLEHVREGQARFVVNNSPLAEASVLGFEYGYSQAEPDALIMWEAQFGDFVNGAQVIIDQFIASAESKWLRMSALTMLLPHGYEGQGPEHSSARVERFLQLCADDNQQVCNITTPANYFHALRRQVRRTIRKPLVVFTPKSLLRHKLATSPLADMNEDTRFRSVIGDTTAAPNQVRRVVLCSGKVYYDLAAARDKAKDAAIIRVEQLYPFPAKTLAAEIARYPNVERVVWCQEEPRNMGAWTFMDRRVEEVSSKRPVYAGRKESASPATGLHSRHDAEQEQLVHEALGVA